MLGLAIVGFVAGVFQSLAGLGEGWEVKFRALPVQYLPSDAVHRDRVGGEEKGAVLPGAEVSVPVAGSAIVSADQAVADVQYDLIADSGHADDSGDKRIAPVDIGGRMGAADVVHQAVGQVF